MKRTIIILCVFLSYKTFGQFDKTELLNMIAICNSYTFLELYNSDKEILPAGFKKIYTSPELGMDNKFQIYTKQNLAVINLRGSTAKKSSWLENIYSAMIPSTGTMTLSGEKFAYCFAKDTAAAVHAGYALAIAFLHKDIIRQIDLLNKEGIYDFIITGHSQGGALANLLKAYLENLKQSKISKKNKFKTYTFAAPMIGNKSFSEEYNFKYGSDNNSFNCVNLSDPIWTLPLSYNDTLNVSTELGNLIFDTKNFNFKKAVKDGAVYFLESGIRDQITKLGTAISKQISKELGAITMPKYVKDINYYHLNERVELKAFEFPRILKDSSILKNPQAIAKLKKGNDGYFLDKDLYMQQSWTYQHKPYNYYVAVLKTYFPDEYFLLKRKYLPENVDRKSVV